MAGLVPAISIGSPHLLIIGMAWTSRSTV